MTKFKLLSMIFCFFALAYSIVLVLGGSFATRGQLCESAVFRSLQPWDSTCFYSALFNYENSLLTDVTYEKYKLDQFRSKQGVSPHVKWYHSLFLRAYRDTFDFTIQEIDRAHWDLMAASPHRTDYHVAYLKYLTSNKRPVQPALDRYCDLYLKNSVHIDSIANQLSQLLAEQELTLDESVCRGYANEKRWTSRYLSEFID